VSKLGSPQDSLLGCPEFANLREIKLRIVLRFSGVFWRFSFSRENDGRAKCTFGWSGVSGGGVLEGNRRKLRLVLLRWAKGDINRLREEEGGMRHFDALILGGCKLYCLWKKGCEDSARCKGYKKGKGEELTFEDFETMAVVGVKTQKQVQFLCPKMNHLSVDEKFSMRTPKVTKKFRFLYNKGVVHDDGTITSFYN